MDDYIIVEIKEKGCFGLKKKENAVFMIMLPSKTEAHKLSIALMLGTELSPSDDLTSYDFVETIEGINYYTYKEKQTDDDSWGMNSCCQSGCRGCPHFKGFN